MKASFTCLLVVAATVLQAASAAAQDVPDTPVARPLPPAWPSWTGLYVGGHVGYAAGTATLASFTAGAPDAARSSNPFGVVGGGVQFGYAHLVGPGLLLGVEADLWFPNFLDDEDRVTHPGATAGGFEERLDLVGTVRGRLGYALPWGLVYGTGGLAWSLGHVTWSPGADLPGVDRWRARPGWTVGAGFEAPLAPGWTARLEYGYDRLASADASFAPSTKLSSSLTLHTLRFGVNWWPGDEDADAREGDAAAGERAFNVHGQFTFVGQGYPSFRSPYEGAHSLSGSGQFKNTLSLTGFLGLRLWHGAEFYFNPELMQGFGLSDVRGIAAFPNGEAQRSNFLVPRFNAARIYLQQTLGLGGDREALDDAPNQLPGARDVSRLTLVVGKFAVTDFFLAARYSGEPRTGFLNWNIYGGGSYDWTMDLLSWTWGGLIELNQPQWAVRAGYFLLPVASNSNFYDTDLFRHGQYLVEVDVRYALSGRPGKLQVTGWLSRGNIGSYPDALALAATAGGPPDVALTRGPTRVNGGFVVSAEQAVTDDLGLFARVSWSPEQGETMGWTDCGESGSLGGTLKGTPWDRPDDVIGLAAVVEGLSPVARDYLEAGGLGAIIGDGKLDYRPEAVIEAYYAFSPVRWAMLTADYQLVMNPGYNADRGPVSIFSARVHAGF